MNEDKKLVQVTIADERWYLKSTENKKTGVPEYKGVPSVTWIAGKYPKGIHFYKWLAEKGWDEAEAIKSSAGNRGSKVHEAIADILQGKEVRIDSKYLNRGTEQMEELTLEECDCILSFVEWFKEVKPEVIAWETTVFSDKHNYAGTVDFIAKIEGEYYIIDFKTSQQVWKEYELQISAYAETIENGENIIGGLPKDVKFKLAILQVGYKRNKAGYKWNEIENKFHLFKNAYAIWEEEHGGEQPTKKDYPVVLFEGLKLEDVMNK